MQNIRKYIFILIFFFLFNTGITTEVTNTNSSYGGSSQTESLLLAKKKRKKRKKKRRKKRRRRKRKKRKRKRKRRNKRKKDKIATQEQGAFEEKKEETPPIKVQRLGVYGIFGLGYFMPSTIDFSPVVEKDSYPTERSDFQEAKIKYTGGLGFDLGVGYRFLDYLAAEFRLFFVYPIVGAKLTVTRKDSGAEVPGVSGGAKMLLPRLFVKGYYPYGAYDFSLGLGAGYLQILKYGEPADEAMALAGISYNAIAEVDYYITELISLGGSFEYTMLNITHIDLWDEDLSEAATNNEVKLTGTMMTFCVIAKYRF